MRNFDRAYTLAAGPAGGTGFEIGFTSPKSPMALNLSFSFQKADLEAANSGKVSIWNLNPAHRAMVETEDCALSLKAGYKGRTPLIFTGIITFASTVPDGADRVTQCEIVDTRTEIRDTQVSVGYKGSVNVRKLLEDTAGQMGVPINFSYNAEFADIANGYSFVGPARDVLGKACDSSGLVWSMQNGVLQVKKPKDVMARQVFLLSAETGMIGSPKRVLVSASDETGKGEVGWDVEYVLNAAINVDDYVKLESREISGFFRVYSIDMQGEYFGQNWGCTARLLEAS